MVVLHAEAVIKEHKTAEFRGHAKSMLEPTRAEPGCLKYDFFVSTEDPHKFIFVEYWESEAHLQAHFETPHFKVFSSNIGDLVAEPPTLTLVEAKSQKQL